MIIGFTGTRQDLPLAQEEALELLLDALHVAGSLSSAHHGDCIGADAAFDRLCHQLGIERHAHPGPDGPARAYCCADLIYPQRPYLDRNRVIVDHCDLLIACPRGPETRRSGTWSTVRYARSVGKTIAFVWPDGHTSHEPARVAS